MVVTFLNDGALSATTSADWSRKKIDAYETKTSHYVGKRLIDILGSGFLILLFSPLLAAVASALAASGHAVLFRQVRIGKGGKSFICFKFRTMAPDADAVLQKVLADNPQLQEEWRRQQKLCDDPRVTRLGKFLRKTSLDELPQLFNVFRGDMSLVGPRPVIAEEMSRYGRSARWYLSVRPGMTGLWQVCRSEETTYSRRVAMDSYYVRKQSFELDVLILLKTFGAVIQN